MKKVHKIYSILYLANMDFYHVISHLGFGSYGTIFKAFDMTSGKVVAIKKLKQKYESCTTCSRLSEVQSLLKLQDHPNIVKIKHFIYENNVFFLYLNT